MHGAEYQQMTVHTLTKPDISPSFTPCFSRKASLYSERSFIKLVLDIKGQNGQYVSVIRVKQGKEMDPNQK